MPVIEGVGDEVFNVLLIALVVALGILGWWSTSITEQPLIRTVLILEPRHHATTENLTNAGAPSPPQDTGQPDPPIVNDTLTETVEVPNRTSSTATKSQNPSEQGNSDDCDPSTSSSERPALSSPIEDLGDESSTIRTEENFSETSTNSNELRKRRLQFFEERQESDCPVKASLSSVSHSEESHEVAQASTSSGSSQDSQPVKDPENIPTEKETSPSESCLACDDIRIRLKFLNDNQKLVQGKLQEPLGDFKRRNFAVEMAARKVIRLIFNGQVLQSDDRTLQNYGLFDNCVVHCLVHNQRFSSPNVENAANINNTEEVRFGGVDIGEAREWDLSNVMYISMFVILTAIWYLRINFSQLFSATSTVALFGLSGIFVIFLVGMYIPDQEVLRT